jgi:PAT family beta-lactamase induction signal transducer AmpG
VLSAQSIRFIGLGFSSGLPFLLCFSTLTPWLVEQGVSATVVGLFVLVTIPYALKFFFSPFVDLFFLPGLTPRLGRRRSCALLAQMLIIGSLLLLSQIQPDKNLLITGGVCLLMALFSAVQDLALEAYRVETTEHDARGTAAWTISFGFRLGYLISGAGAIYLATLMSWSHVYMVMAAFMLVGMLTVLNCPESGIALNLVKRQKGFAQFLWRDGVLKLNQSHPLMFIITLIGLSKFADAILHTMNVPFLLGLGYSKMEIAEIVKFMGATTMIFGGLLGGILLNHLGLGISFIITNLFQVIAVLAFVFQAFTAQSFTTLIMVIGLENIASGFTTTTLIAYISALARPPYTAIQYGLLASIGSIARIIWSALSGVVVDALLWRHFFVWTSLGTLPALFLVIYYRKHLDRIWNKSPGSSQGTRSRRNKQPAPLEKRRFP